MKRLFILTGLVLVLGAGSAYAQSPTSRNSSVHNAIAAAISKATLPAPKVRVDLTAVRLARTPVFYSSKPFMKTPWPYVIIAAAVVVIVVARNGGGTSSGY